MIPKIIIKGIKNFLVCFCKSKIKNIEKIKRIIGILFPDKIIPSKKITKSIGIKNFEILFEYFEKKIGNTKNANKENLWIKLPAISSSPNGPLNFLLYKTFYKKYFTNTSIKDNNLIIPFIFLFIVEIFPIKSTGSFFTTGNSTYLFLIMGILVGLLSKDNIMKKKG